jgi:uncharacterized membrane protein SirB2
MRGLQHLGFVIGMILIGIAILMAVINKISNKAAVKVMRNKITMTLVYIGIGILALSYIHSCLKGGTD